MDSKDATLAMLGKRLRNAREAKGFSQRELARRCGVHRTYVGAVERGECNITILTLRKLVRTLGLTLEEVFDDVDHPRSYRTAE